MSVSKAERPAIVGYEILDLLGEGASAKVYRARHVGLGGRLVALKVLDRGLFGEQASRMFEIERSVLSDLPKDSSLMTVFDGGITSKGEPFLAMELCPGGSLSRYINGSGVCDLSHAVRVCSRMANALRLAHSRDIIHGDLKPGNILISQLGEPVLSDFGIATILDQDRTDNDTRYTLHYAAPELLRNGAPSTASDLYALGSTLFCLLVGHPPHERHRGENPARNVIFGRVLNDSDHVLPAHVDVPKDFRRLVDALLKKDQGRRPDRAEDVNATILEIETRLGIREHAILFSTPTDASHFALSADRFPVLGADRPEESSANPPAADDRRVNSNEASETVVGPPGLAIPARPLAERVPLSEWKVDRKVVEPSGRGRGATNRWARRNVR